MMQLPDAAAIVVFGASGDLANRKLYPALAALASRNQLPERCAIVGIARTVDSDGDMSAEVRAAVKAVHPDLEHALDKVTFRYVQGTFDDPALFQRLSVTLNELDVSLRLDGNALYYLAIAPQVIDTVSKGLASVDLEHSTAGGFRRLIVEKPFGHDTESAKALNASLLEVWQENQLYRIDHYLAKETVRNILALRFTNTIFEPLWNRRYVDRVELTIAESLGVEHRGTFYEHAGAIRDIVQNHLLQVLAFIAMEPPARFSPEDIRDEKFKLLSAIRSFGGADGRKRVVRGQYTAGEIDGEAVLGYREEDGVNKQSMTETYVAARIAIDNWRWAGVPFYIRTGKRLPRRTTEVALTFKPVPFLPLPPEATESLEPNVLRIRIQPDEGVNMSMSAKVPGAGFSTREVNLGFSYADGFPGVVSEAYEHVLHEALKGDSTLFLRADEVERAWEVVQPLLNDFAANAIPLEMYPAGTWGPAGAEHLLEAGDTWRTT